MKKIQYHKYAIIENKWDIHTPKWIVQFDNIDHYQKNIIKWTYDYLANNGKDIMGIDYHIIAAKVAYIMVNQDNIIFHKA